MKNILIEQNKHWRGDKYKSIKREKLSKLISYLPLKQIITITGIRRCGKSTLLKQAINYLLDSGVDAKNILFINLEHPYFLEFQDNPNFLNKIYDEYLKIANPQGKVYCFFDEIQYFKNWQVYIKNRYETSDEKYIITGSNSSMLSNELNTLLSGRSLNIHLSTFNFREFLNYKGIEYKDNIERVANRIEIARAKDEFLKWGGFYEVFDVKDESIKKDLLISYAKNIIYQDIIPRYGIRNYNTIERLFFYLLSNATNIVNYTTLSKTFAVSDKTIKEYINHFEDTFMFKRIDKFHNKSKEQIKSSKKLYILDNGFLQIATKHSLNLGAMLENSVFNLLNENFEDITYCKEKYEIDFCTYSLLVQVSYDISNKKTLSRELNAFNYYSREKKVLVTYDNEDQVNDIEIIQYEDFAIDSSS